MTQKIENIESKLKLCDKDEIKKYSELLDDAIFHCRHMTDWELNFMQSMQRLHSREFVLTKCQYKKIKQIIWNCEVEKLSENRQRELHGV